MPSFVLALATNNILFYEPLSINSRLSLTMAKTRSSRSRIFGFFESLVLPYPKPQREPPPKGFLAFIFHYAKDSKRFIAIMALSSGAIAALEVTLFGFLGRLVDQMNALGPAAFLSEQHGSLLAMGIVLAILLPACVATHSLLLHQTILANFPMRIRWLAHNYLLEQSARFYQDEFAGRIATKVLQTALAVRETILKSLDVILYVAVYFISVLALVASLDWRLVLPLVLWLLAYACIMAFFLPRLERISSKQADARSEMTGRIVDTYTNMTTVKLFSHASRESAYAREAMDGFLDTAYPQMRLATSLNLSIWAINILLIFSITAMAIALWSNAFITTGAIAVAIALVLRIYSMSQWVMWEISALFENIGVTRDGMNTLTLKHDIINDEDANEIKVDHGEIELDKVSFAYEKASPVFKDLSLRIDAGERVGVVGHSGSGKSTLLNLLLRFYDIQSGSVCIDGQNIAGVTQESLRKNVGMVTQDTSLLHRSIRENIAYGRQSASDDEIIEAAKQAKAWDFIQTLVDNKGRRALDAHVGERGVKLSGGQRQRVAIARVLLKDAPILVLDEATSALDSEVELAIQENLKQLMEGKTVIAIAHRLSTIAALDRLIVMEEGRVIENGSHAELLKQQGVYAELWRKQSDGFV